MYIAPFSLHDTDSDTAQVKALCYKPEGRGFDEMIFLNLPNPSGCTRHWGLLSL
jgi:hypothetical protein